MINEQQHRQAVEAAYKEGYEDGRGDEWQLSEAQDIGTFGLREHWQSSKAKRQLDQLPAPGDGVMVPRAVAIDCEKLIGACEILLLAGIPDVTVNADYRKRVERLAGALPLVPDSIREVEG